MKVSLEMPLPIQLDDILWDGNNCMSPCFTNSVSSKEIKDNFNMFYRETGLWNMQNLKPEWRFYKETKGTKLIPRFQMYLVIFNLKRTRQVSCSFFVLKRNYICRHYMGEDLENLNFKELQNLEQQLDSALKHIRSRKVKSLQEYKLLIVQLRSIK